MTIQKLLQWSWIFSAFLFTSCPGETVRTATTSIPNNNQRSSSYLLLCLTDGSIYSVSAWTGEFQHWIVTDPLLQKHSRTPSSSSSPTSSSSPSTAPSTTSSNSGGTDMIVPGLDGRLYWKNPKYGTMEDDDSAAPMLQELPLTVAGLLENPVRSCNPHNDETEECGILTAQAETSLLAISGSGELLWKSRNSHEDDTTTSTKSSSSSSLPTLLLQRKDYWIQHIHATTGKQSWNVSLGTYQALDFSTPDEEEERKRQQRQNKKLLLDDDDVYDETENGDFNVVNDEDDVASILPAIFFSNHGRRLSAVDPRTREILWRQDVPSTFSAVFGISNGQWKTLEIVDDSELMRIMMITHQQELQNQQQDATNTPQSTFGQDFHRAPGGTNNNPWIQEIEEFLWQQQQQQYRSHHTQQIPIHKALPGGSVSSKSNREEGQQQGQYHHADIYTQCVLLGGDSCPNLKQLPLRLPGPATNINEQAKSVFLLEEGLLLSWKLVSILVIVLVLAGVGIRVWYLLKKAKWMDPSHALPKPNTADTILLNHSSSGDVSGNAASSLMLVRKRSNSLPGKLGEEWFGRDPLSLLWKNLDGMRNSDDAIQRMATPAIPKQLPTPLPQPPVPSRPVHGMTTPRTITNISGNSAIPLVRYSRYASEFQELRALGKGGFGSVFQCRNSLDGRDYAIKKICIRGASSDDAKFQIQLERVLREVKNLAVLNHPCIVRYYTAWLEIEERKNADDNSTARQIGDETGSALSSALYEKPSGIIRRRYSSSNLLASEKYDSGWGDHTMSSRKFDGDDDSSASDWDVPGQKNGRGRPIRHLHYACTDARESREESEVLSFMPRRRSLRNRSSMDDLILFEDSQEEKAQSNRISQEDPTLEASPMRRRRSFSMGDNATSFADKSVWSNSLKSRITTSEGARTSMKHTLYIQMELCSQNTVAEFLADAESRRGPLSTSESSGVDIPKALGLFLQIAEAVKHVHEQGLIHRDLKPSNCFMNESGSVKVGDFGLSRESNNEEESNGSSEAEEQQKYRSRTLSNANEDHTAGVGTRSYASPEQMKGSDYDSSTDVYSLGIILFELLYPMYTGMERGICLSQLREHKFPIDWEQVVGDNFSTMKELIIRMLSWRPSERPTADSVVRQIQSVLGEYRVSSLDKQHFEGKPDMIILRVEAIHRDDALSTTMKLIREESSLIDSPVEIVHYGLRSGSTGNQQPSAIMEFALKFHDSHNGSDVDDQNRARNHQSAAASLVQQLCKHPDILKARQISSGVLSSSSGTS